MGLLEGDAIRGAMKWLAERRLEAPSAPRLGLIDEAARRFDLTPLEVEFLVGNWREPEAEPAKPGTPV
jgi:hypothetical protein